MTGITLRGEANEQFSKTFFEARPAPTFLEASKLPYGASVEIDAVAYIGE